MFHVGGQLLQQLEIYFLTTKDRLYKYGEAISFFSLDKQKYLE